MRSPGRVAVEGSRQRLSRTTSSASGGGPEQQRSFGLDEEGEQEREREREKRTDSRQLIRGGGSDGGGARA